MEAENEITGPDNHVDGTASKGWMTREGLILDWEGKEGMRRELCSGGPGLLYGQTRLHQRPTTVARHIVARALLPRSFAGKPGYRTLDPIDISLQ